MPHYILFNRICLFGITMKLLQMPSIEIEPDVQDTSLPGPGDISVHEGPPPVTWQVVDEGTSRCKAKLCNSLGYSYTARPAGKRGR